MPDSTDIAIGVGILGGGYLLYNEIFGLSEKAKFAMEQYERMRLMLKEEAENPESLEEEDYQSHAGEAKATSQAIYSECLGDEEKEAVDEEFGSPDEVESNMEGMSIEERALEWKVYASTLSEICYMSEADDPLVDDWVIIAAAILTGAAAYGFGPEVAGRVIDKIRNTPEDERNVETLDVMVEDALMEGTDVEQEVVEAQTISSFTQEPTSPETGEPAEVIGTVKMEEIRDTIPDSAEDNMDRIVDFSEIAEIEISMELVENMANDIGIPTEEITTWDLVVIAAVALLILVIGVALIKGGIITAIAVAIQQILARAFGVAVSLSASSSSVGSYGAAMGAVAV